jgi:hypothetical protein
MTNRRTPANERGEPADKAEWNWSHRGARGVLVSVFDMHALLTALLGDKLLTADQRAVLWRPIAGDSYGVTALPANGETMVRVHGHTVGYRARWLVQPSTRSWIVILTEDYGSTDAVEAALAAEAWQAAAVAMAPPAPTPAAGTPNAGTSSGDALTVGAWSDADAERFVGTFELPRGGDRFRIERTAKGLQIVGIGLQASARLLHGGWPPPGEDRLRRAEDRGLALLNRVLADDKKVDDDGFESASVGKSARDELRTWQQRNGGKPRLVQYAGTTLTGHGETWFRIVATASGSEVLVRAAWNSRGEWLRCSIADEPLPFAAPLTWIRPDAATILLANGTELLVTMEGTKDKRRLVYEDQTGGGEGLLDCNLVPGG